MEVSTDHCYAVLGCHVHYVVSRFISYSHPTLSGNCDTHMTGVLLNLYRSPVEATVDYRILLLACNGVESAYLVNSLQAKEQKKLYLFNFWLLAAAYATAHFKNCYRQHFYFYNCKSYRTPYPWS